MDGGERNKRQKEERENIYITARPIKGTGSQWPVPRCRNWYKNVGGAERPFAFIFPARTAAIWPVRARNIIKIRPVSAPSSRYPPFSSFVRLLLTATHPPFIFLSLAPFFLRRFSFFSLCRRAGIYTYAEATASWASNADVQMMRSLLLGSRCAGRGKRVCFGREVAIVSIQREHSVMILV